MAYLSFTRSNVHSIFWPTQQRLLKQTGLAVLAALLLAGASQISIPLQPVPLTFQSATVVLLGLTLGARLGLVAIMTYLIAGLSGLPVFADFSAGPAVFAGPTGGYLLGFIPAVLIGGYLAQRGWVKSYLSLFTAAILAVSMIFIVGVAYLSTFIGFHTALLVGLKPFIVTEVLKLMLVTIAAKQAWR